MGAFTELEGSLSCKPKLSHRSVVCCVCESGRCVLGPTVLLCAPQLFCMDCRASPSASRWSYWGSDPGELQGAVASADLLLLLCSKPMTRAALPSLLTPVPVTVPPLVLQAHSWQTLTLIIGFPEPAHSLPRPQQRFSNDSG